MGNAVNIADNGSISTYLRKIVGEFNTNPKDGRFLNVINPPVYGKVKSDFFCRRFLFGAHRNNFQNSNCYAQFTSAIWSQRHSLQKSKCRSSTQDSCIFQRYFVFSSRSYSQHISDSPFPSQWLHKRSIELD